MQKVGDSGGLHPKWDVFTTPLPLKAQELCEEEAERLLEPEGLVNSKETGFPKHNRTDTDMISQRLWQNTQSLQGFKLNGVLALGWGAVGRQGLQL